MTRSLFLQNKNITKNDSDVNSNFLVPASSGPNFNSYSESRVYLSSNSTSRDYGAYYNWFTATAGQGVQTFSSGDTTTSICPKGWRLPTSNEWAEFVNLYPKNVVQNSPTFLKSSGYYTGANYTWNHSDCTECYGLYWSSTAHGRGQSSNLHFCSCSSYCVDCGYYTTNNGGSVRCVSRNTAN